MRVVAAHALDREVLDGAQQLGLGREREVRDLVEKERPSVGGLELATPATDAGGRAIFDAEQLGLEQRLHERRTVDCDERAVPAPAQIVDLTRDELLAHAAFAFDEHGEVGGGDALDRRSQRLHDHRRSNERRRAVAPHATGIEQPRADELQARAFDFQHEGADVRGQPEHLKVPFAEAATWIEGRFQ